VKNYADVAALRLPQFRVYVYIFYLFIFEYISFGGHFPLGAFVIQWERCSFSNVKKLVASPGLYLVGVSNSRRRAAISSRGALCGNGDGVDPSVAAFLAGVVFDSGCSA
jgi:hypothetical protein